MCSRYTQLADASGATNMFDEMMSLRVLPTRVTYNSLIGNSARLVDTKAAKFWFDKMRTVRIPVNRISFNSMISAYAREGDAVVAKKYFDMLVNAGKQLPDSRSYDSMLLCAVVCGDGSMAEQWFHQMKDSGTRPSVTSFNTVMQAFCSRGDLQKVKSWHAELENCEFTRPNETTFATIVEACAIGSDAKSAQEVLEQMTKANFVDVNISASVLYAHLVNNDVRSARSILARIPSTSSSSTTTTNESPPTFTKMLEFTELFGSVLADGQLPVTDLDENRCIIEINKAAEALDVFRVVVWLSKMEQCSLTIGAPTLQLVSEVFCKRRGSQGVRRWWGKMLSVGIVPHHAIYHAAVKSLRSDSAYDSVKVEPEMSAPMSVSSSSSPSNLFGADVSNAEAEPTLESNSISAESNPDAPETDPSRPSRANGQRIPRSLRKLIPGRMRVVPSETIQTDSNSHELWHLQEISIRSNSIKSKARQNVSGQAVFMPDLDD